MREGLKSQKLRSEKLFIELFGRWVDMEDTGASSFRHDRYDTLTMKGRCSIDNLRLYRDFGVESDSVLKVLTDLISRVERYGTDVGSGVMEYPSTYFTRPPYGRQYASHQSLQKLSDVRHYSLPHHIPLVDFLSWFPKTASYPL